MAGQGYPALHLPTAHGATAASPLSFDRGTAETGEVTG